MDKLVKKGNVMNYLKTGLLTATLITTGIVIGPKAVDAYRGDPNVQGPNYTEEHHEAMTNAFTSGDYQAWKNLMQGRGRVTQMVNEQNFARFVQAHNASLAGDMQTAAAIRAELGLGLHDGSGYRGGQGQGQGRGNGYNR